MTEDSRTPLYEKSFLPNKDSFRLTEKKISRLSQEELELFRQRLKRVLSNVNALEPTDQEYLFDVLDLVAAREQQLESGMDDVKTRNLSRFAEKLGTLRAKITEIRESISLKAVRTFGLIGLLTILVLPALINAYDHRHEYKQEAKQLILDSDDPNCGIAAAFVDELGGIEKVVEGVRLLHAFATDACGQIVGDYALVEQEQVPQISDVVLPTPTLAPSRTYQAEQTESDYSDFLTNLATPKPTTEPAPEQTPNVDALPSTANTQNANNFADPTPAATSEAAEIIRLPFTNEMLALLSQADSPQKIQELLSRISTRNLESVTYVSDRGITSTTLSLPPEIINHPHRDEIENLIGQNLTTRTGERLPAGVIAQFTILPAEYQARLGPFVWSMHPDAAYTQYQVPANALYGQNNYPQVLLAEIHLQDYFRSNSYFSSFRPTDRLRSFGWLGHELAQGRIQTGSPYISTDEQGHIRLYEYPNLPNNQDAANLIWNFNPLNPATGLRQFKIPPYLLQQQTGHALHSFNSEADEGNIGPSVIFRTNTQTGETDIVTLTPFLLSYGPSLFEDILLNTPLNGKVVNPHDLIIAAGDLHFSSNGYLGPLVDWKRPPASIDQIEGSNSSVNYSQYRNATGLYIGFRE